MDENLETADGRSLQGSISRGASEKSQKQPRIRSEPERRAAAGRSEVGAGFREGPQPVVRGIAAL
jgi:hypothetical protein